MSDKWLETARDQIDKLDAQIIELIAARFELIKNIGTYKKNHNIPMMQPERVQFVITKCEQQGDKYGLNKDLISNIYKLIIAEACESEDKIINS